MLYLQDRVNALETVSWGIFFLLLSELLLCPEVDFRALPKEAVPESICKTASRIQRGE